MMKQNLTLLMRRLLASDYLLERIEISKTIIHFLNTSIRDFGPIELVMREHFIKMIKVCAVHFDSCKSTVALQIAIFYKENYIDGIEELPFAA